MASFDDAVTRVCSVTLERQPEKSRGGQVGVEARIDSRESTAPRGQFRRGQSAAVDNTWGPEFLQSPSFLQMARITHQTFQRVAVWVAHDSTGYPIAQSAPRAV